MKVKVNYWDLTEMCRAKLKKYLSKQEIDKLNNIEETIPTVVIDWLSIPISLRDQIANIFTSQQVNELWDTLSMKFKKRVSTNSTHTIILTKAHVQEMLVEINDYWKNSLISYQPNVPEALLITLVKDVYWSSIPIKRQLSFDTIAQIWNELRLKPCLLLIKHQECLQNIKTEQLNLFLTDVSSVIREWAQNKLIENEKHENI